MQQAEIKVLKLSALLFKTLAKIVDHSFILCTYSLQSINTKILFLAKYVVELTTK